MRNFWLIRDEEITFAVRIQMANELVMHPTLDSLFTPQGCIIPLSTDSWNLLDYLETGEWDWVSTGDGPLGAVLTHSGKLYEIFINERGLMRRRLPYGKGSWHCKAYRYQVEESVQASVEMGGTTAEIVKRVEQTQLMVAGTYVTMPISKLLEMLKEKYPEPQPLPSKACLRPVPEKESE